MESSFSIRSGSIKSSREEERKRAVMEAGRKAVHGVKAEANKSIRKVPTDKDIENFQKHREFGCEP